MRYLHVAALPYPTQQGTQAAIHAMLSAQHAAGQASELLCYAHGAHALSPPYRIHRLERTLGVTSLRSGPSVGKLALDVLLTRKLAALVQARAPDWVVAHHVEAALSCIAAGLRRFAFVAHTSLADELAFYFSPALRGVWRWAGAALDRGLCAGSPRLLAVSPALAQTLGRYTDKPVQTLRVPWPLPASSGKPERNLSRASLRLTDADQVVLYAGNLDRYQGLPLLVEALRLLARDRPSLVLLIATQDPRADLLRRGEATLRMRVVPLADELDRQRVHAAADVVAVPRASAGGIPIKLLDALARGCPVVATRRASAGLPLDDVCTLVADDDAWAMAGALALLLDTPERSRAAATLGPAYIAREHGGAAFLKDLAAGLRSTAECSSVPRSFPERPVAR